MAMLFANRIILGTAKWEQVPRLLKQQVADLLIECGCEDLITEDAFKPKEESEAVQE